MAPCHIKNVLAWLHAEDNTGKTTSIRQKWIKGTQWYPGGEEAHVFKAQPCKTTYLKAPLSSAEWSIFTCTSVDYKSGL